LMGFFIILCYQIFFMKLSLTPLLILLFIAIKSFTQETKKVTEGYGDGSSKVKEIYYVLKDDRAVKQGPYQRYFTDKLQITGFYKMGKKDSVWQRYHHRGSVVSKKMYTENRKTGTWEFYKNDGTIDWQYDFNTDSFTNKPKEEPDYSYQSSTGEWVNGKADRGPVWLRSLFEWQSFINWTLRYPQKAIDQNKMGKVAIEVTLDENGDAIDYSVVESAFPPLDEEALRIVKIFQPEFLPAEKDGKKVKTKVRIAIHFRFER
jgi:TonB family protein